MNNMPETLDYTEVPYLEDILNYLPIDPADDEDIISYIQNITSLIAVNYKYEQYQFAYFGVHLLYMTYIYCTIWKISRITPERYSDSIVYARPYNGRERDFNIDDANSIFAYSLVPEKDVSKIFKLIDLDKSQISSVGGLVDVRNDMAHASGKFEILTDDGFNVKANAVLTSIRNIHRCMDKQIRAWFSDFLLDYCNGKYSDYNEIQDIIIEQMIQNFKLSVNELLVCNEMSVRDLISEYRKHEHSLKDFKSVIEAYCDEFGYI